MQSSDRISRSTHSSPPHPPPFPTMKASDALPALDALLNGDSTLKAALRSVATSTGVSLGALKTAHFRRANASPSKHGNRLLTAEQEDTVVGVVQTFSINVPLLYKLQVREMVARRRGVAVSEVGMRRFLDHHLKQLRTRTWKASGVADDGKR